MIRSEPLVGSDVRLERLRALDDDARERAIADLIVSVAQPIAAHVIRRYTGDGGAVPEADAEDILSGVALRVLVKLRSLGEAEDVIRSFDDYVAMLAYNAVSDHLRYRYPMRTRARNRVRYVLAHDARLELWSSGKRLVGGLAGWKKTIAAARDEGVSLPDAVRRRMSDGDRPADDLVILFEHTGRPLPLDLLVDLCAAAWRMIDAALPPPAEKASEPAALANLELR